MTEHVPSPRIYCIPATEAPIVAVFRRGPTSWSHVGRWDLAEHRYEPGAWLAGRLFPRRSDLSPDGRILCYFAHKPGATWEHGDTYVALSKLPWLTALRAIGTDGTWTRGYRFAAKGTCDTPHGAGSPIPYSLCPQPALQFANERHRGWEETADCPPRDPNDIWDQRRNVRLRKDQPVGNRSLFVESLGWAGGEFGVDQAVDGLRVRYYLDSGGDREFLDDLQWADWDLKGRLLGATRSGKLQVRDLDSGEPVTVFEQDLSALEPNPAPAPLWAERW